MTRLTKCFGRIASYQVVTAPFQIRPPLLQPCIVTRQRRGLLQRERTYSTSTLSFPSTTPQSPSRSTLETCYEDMKRVLPTDLYELALMGDYRRGVKDVNEATVLVVGLQDERMPSSLADHYTEEETAISSQLLKEGIIEQKEEAQSNAEHFVLSQDPTIPVRIHYVPKACHGAARLYLTGDASYIRFLKLLATEDVGVTLTKLGLWRSESARKRRVRADHTKPAQGTLPAGVVIEKIESEGDRRMRETRKEMGLPEGLDLSLDLGPGPKTKNDMSDDHKAEVEVSDAEDIDDYQYIKVDEKQGEASILDYLGMVWIPPQMRTVKGLE